jgi:small Trp-rich protein
MAILSLQTGSYDLLQSTRRALLQERSMYLLVVGLILAALKLFDVAPVVNWDWWWVLSPFALAALWWWFADASGYTKRKAMEREEQRKQQRLQDSRDRLRGTKR